jgi:glycosyltransferase involved in cell wall biosynthesis
VRMINFVEGALSRKGGIGIPGIPILLAGMASRGHRIVVLMGGSPLPGQEDYFRPDVAAALKRPEGNGSLGVVSFPAWNWWGFSPRLLTSLPGVWRLTKGADVIGLHSIYSFPVLLGCVIARLQKKPYVLWLHGVLAPVQRRISSRKKRIYDSLITARLINGAAAIFFTARGERREVEGLGITAPSVVVPLGVPAREFAELPERGRFRARYLRGHSGPVLLFLARLNAKKGIDLLLKTMARVVAQRPDVLLAIVGPPDPPSYEEKVREWIRENHLETSAIIIGPVGPSDRLEAMADADIFVLPSEAENFGFSVFEAMASRVPVVVSDTLNYAEEIQNSGAGFSVPRDPDRFAEAILHLLDNPELRREMGKKGLEMALRFSSDATGGNVERVLNSVINALPLPADLAV